MDSKSQLTVDVVAKVAMGKIDIVNAAKLLDKSRRTIERYLSKYHKVGIQFVVHRNTGKSPFQPVICRKVEFIRHPYPTVSLITVYPNSRRWLSHAML